VGVFVSGSFDMMASGFRVTEIDWKGNPLGFGLPAKNEIMSGLDSKANRPRIAGDGRRWNSVDNIRS